MDAYLLSAVRTPIGKFLGEFSDLTAPQLGALVAREALTRAGVAAEKIDETIFGNVLQAGVGQNPARQVALKAGLPDTVAAFTVNKVCGSGLKAVMLAAQAIRAGDAHTVLAGGCESMSRAPHLLPGSRVGLKYGDGKLVDALIHDGLWCPFENWPMGEAAEYIALECGATRMDQDQLSVESHRRASKAWESGAFAAEVMEVAVGSGSKARTIKRDEGIRADSTIEGLARLKPAFRSDGTVTAGNASQLSDGAAATVVASADTVRQSGARPLAKIVAYCTSGVAPREIFRAPVPAIGNLLKLTGWTLADVDLIELNEAFAAQVLACSRELGLDESRLNVHGGAIAMGHPIGASGTRVLVTLLHALKSRDLRRGIASLCLGGGNAVALAVERDRICL